MLQLTGGCASRLDIRQTLEGMDSDTLRRLCVHGGISPAEILVPLLAIRAWRGRRKERKVSAKLLSAQ